MKEKKHMIISIEAEIAFDKNPTLFHDKKKQKQKHNLANSE